MTGFGRKLLRCSAAMVAALLSSAATPVAALDALLDEPSRLSLLGDTNHGTWQCGTGTIDANFRVDLDRDAFNRLIAGFDAQPGTQPAARIAGGRLPALPDLRLRLPVAALDCGHRVMERDLGRALRAAQYPEITFDLRRVESFAVVRAGQYVLAVSGALRLAGAEQIVVIRLAAIRVAPDQFRFTAELPLRMTQFGITPPAGLFGLIQSADELVIRFDLLFTIADAPPPARPETSARSGRGPARHGSR